MNKYSSFVLEKLKELIPMSVFSEVICFTFYDEHPKDTRNLDVTVCSERGLVQEFYKREAVGSFLIPQVNKVKEIELLRNVVGELWYFVVAESEIIILSRDCETDSMEVYQRIPDVHTYIYGDQYCKGQPSLTVYPSRTVPPILHNEVFEDQRNEPPGVTSDASVTRESEDLTMEAMPRIIEFETTYFPKNSLHQDLAIRKQLVYNVRHKVELDSNKSVFKLDQDQIFCNLLVSVKPLKVKLFNKKIIIISSLQNRHHVTLTDFAIILHSPKIESFNYTTKMFNEISTSPYWEEVGSEIGVDKTSTIVALVDYKEVGKDKMKNINFDVVVSYKRGDCSNLLSLGSVNISIADLLQDKFNVLSENEETHSLFFTVMSSSKKVNLCLRKIKEINEDYLNVSQIFCTYLKMEPMGIGHNVFIHKKYPNHILYGVMVAYEEIDDPAVINFHVYSRCYWQVVTLINYIYVAVPGKIIVTSSDYEYVNIVDDIVNYKDVSDADQFSLSYETLKTGSRSALQQILLVTEFFQFCRRHMVQQRDENAKNEIDMFKAGVEKYLRFRTNMINEAHKFVRILSANKKPVFADLTPLF